MTIKVFQTKTNGKDRVAVKSPYYPSFTDEARKLNGKWNVNQWEFDPRDEQRVRDVLVKCYGTDGTPGQLVETVTVTVEITRATPNPYFAYGREIVNRRSRDSYPKLGEGVVVIEGDFDSSSGSRNNPSLVSGYGQVVKLEVRDVPVSLVKDTA